jgi:tRNA(fMet)-specific endonuclease VapC
VILDSSVLIAWERGKFDLNALLLKSGGGDVAIASITASELLHGVERAPSEAVRTRRSQTVEGLLEILPTIPFGISEARVHARLWAALASKGRMIGPHDLLVAATCVAHAHALATLNVKEFKRVPGLRILA